MARLVSAQVAPDTTTYTTLSETDIKYGMFPPLSITADNITATSVDISWDPGLETEPHHRVQDLLGHRLGPGLRLRQQRDPACSLR